MADESQSRSGGDHKRKLEDPPLRRPTGFSSASPDAKAPPPSYNSVPPPPDDIQLAKQRAQEIAARLFSDAEAKRPRVDNGAPLQSDDSKPFSSSASAAAAGDYKPLGFQSQVGGLGTASYPSYGYNSTSKKIDIPNGRVGVIIGKGGETIKYLQLQSGAKIQVTRDMDADPNSQTRPVELMGTAEQISKAEQLINDVLEQAEAGGSGLAAARTYVSGQPGTEHFTMKIPNNKVGLVIGKGGETIKSMQARSGAHIQVVPLHLPPGDLSSERTLHIDGSKEQIDSAKQLVDEILNSETRVRNPPMAGGYQHYRPPRPQTSWAPPGQAPMQQPGYGYMQPGAYPGPPPQYGMQPPYAGYPPPPTSAAGYSSGWDQTGNSQSQPSAPGSGYDYYNQQGQAQQQTSATDTATATYNYGQPPPSTYNQQGSYGDGAYTQQPVSQPGYGQDGYTGAYGAPPSQSGYTQPPPSSQPGYDQSQSYGSAQYNTAPNATQDGSTPTYAAQGGSTQTAATQQATTPSSQPPVTQQAYSTQQPGTTPPSYPPQGTQLGYGMPPTSQPGYGGQQLPVPSGYGQPPSQPGYSQPSPGQKPPPSPAAGYGQPSSYGSQPPPAPSTYGGAPAPSGYAAGGAQPGYGQQPPYASAPPPGQAGYGQPSQQSYGEAYGSGGYGAPPAAYTGAGDSTGGGSGVPASQPASGGVKASPQTQA